VLENKGKEKKTSGGTFKAKKDVFSRKIRSEGGCTHSPESFVVGQTNPARVGKTGQQFETCVRTQDKKNIRAGLCPTCRQGFYNDNNNGGVKPSSQDAHQKDWGGGKRSRGNITENKTEHNFATSRLKNKKKKKIDDSRWV